MKPSGHDITIECTANWTFNPETIVWKFNEGRLPSNVKLDYKRIIIRNALIENSGIYQCTVSDTIRLYSASSEIVVFGELIWRVQVIFLQLQHS